jgi:hypothetical protein
MVQQIYVLGALGVLFVGCGESASPGAAATDAESDSDPVYVVPSPAEVAAVVSEAGSCGGSSCDGGPCGVEAECYTCGQCTTGDCVAGECVDVRNATRRAQYNCGMADTGWPDCGDQSCFAIIVGGLAWSTLEFERFLDLQRCEEQSCADVEFNDCRRGACEEETAACYNGSFEPSGRVSCPESATCVDLCDFTECVTSCVDNARGEFRELFARLVECRDANGCEELLDECMDQNCGFITRLCNAQVD